jgi:hypothetical protein
MRSGATRGTSSLRARLLFARLNNDFTLGVESQFVPPCGSWVSLISTELAKELILESAGEVKRVG